MSAYRFTEGFVAFVTEREKAASGPRDAAAHGIKEFTGAAATITTLFPELPTGARMTDDTLTY